MVVQRHPLRTRMRVHIQRPAVEARASQGDAALVIRRVRWRPDKPRIRSILIVPIGHIGIAGTRRGGGTVNSDPIDAVGGYESLPEPLLQILVIKGSEVGGESLTRGPRIRIRGEGAEILVATVAKVRPAGCTRAACVGEFWKKNPNTRNRTRDHSISAKSTVERSAN